MTENDQYVIQLRNNDIESLLYSNELTNINCNLILEYIKELDLFQNIEYNFEDEKNRLMLEDFNKTEYMSYREFEHVYAVTNLIPSYTMFFLDYAILTKNTILPELFDEENIYDDSSFAGFENIPDDIKNIFYALTTTYKKILEVLSPNDDSKSSKMINIGDHSISYMTKVYYMVYYSVYYSKGILSNGKPNNVSTIKEKKVEGIKEKKSVLKKKKSENIILEQNDQENLDLSVFVKNISSTMTEYWMNDDYSWKEIQENLGLVQDAAKLEIFSKLQNKFDIDYSYDMKSKSFALKLRIKN